MVFIWSCLISSNRNEATWDTVLVSGQPGYDDYLDWICPRSRSFESPYKQIHNTEKHTASHTYTRIHKLSSAARKGACMKSSMCVLCACLFIPLYSNVYLYCVCIYLHCMCVYVYVRVCFSYLKKSYQGHCRD